MEEKTNRSAAEVNNIQAMFYPQEDKEIDEVIEEEYSQELKMTRKKKFDSQAILAEVEGNEIKEELMNEVLNF